MEGGHYVLRAELPGIDPAKEVDITVYKGQLTIKAERTEKKEARAARSSATARSPGRLPCRRAPMKRISKPPTTRAS